MKSIVILLLFPFVCFSQVDTFLIKEMYYDKKDTLVISEIDEIQILYFKNKDDQKYFRRLKYKTLKVYPYAKLASAKLDSVLADLDSIPKRRKKKAYMKAVEKWAKEELAEDLKQLSRWEGRILSKLIYRETNISAYDIVKDLRGGFHAFFWQSLARMYDNNLKTPYQPQSVEEDKWIEYIIQDAKRKGLID
ncbi:DUF4294 domain-containing protein [Flavobacteriales bacterium]|nr:DUF4294 domain-containing protein [Flavobacteriales bacterium]